MKPSYLLLVLTALIAIMAMAQNQPTPDQRIARLEKRVSALENRLSMVESRATR
jgi:hypothetical protein